MKESKLIQNRGIDTKSRINIVNQIKSIPTWIKKRTCTLIAEWVDASDTDAKNAL